MKRIALLSLIAASYVMAYDYNLDFKVGSQSMDYREYDKDTKSLLDTEKETLKDINKYSTKVKIVDPKRGFLFDEKSISLEYSKASFDTKYTGSIMGSGNPYGSVVSSTSNDVTDYTITVSEGIKLSRDLKTYLNLGFGNYKWERTLSAAQIETYKWWYFTLGNSYTYDITKKLNVGLDLKYMKAIDPKMDAYSPSETINFKLGSTSGYTIGIPLVYKVTDNLALLSDYTYGYTKINQSNIVSGYYEPESKNYSHNVNVGFRLTF